MEKTRCSCSHHLIIPALIAIIGLTFLLKNVGILPAWPFEIIWPGFVAIIGLSLLVSRRCKCFNDHSHCNHCHHCMHDGQKS